MIQLTLFYRTVSVWWPCALHHENMFLDTLKLQHNLVQCCKLLLYTALQKFPQHFLHEEHFTNVWDMNNFSWALYFIFEYCISQHCRLYLYISQGKVTMLNNKCYQGTSKPVSKHWVTKWRFSGQAWVNKFLAGWSKDKFDTPYYTWCPTYYFYFHYRFSCRRE
jgi:hypothetical protein